MKRQGLLSLTGILLLVLLALLTMHEWERVVPDGNAKPADKAPPMLQLSGVSGRSFGKLGDTEFTMEASHLNWLEKKGISEVTQPRIWLPLADGDWQIEADRGTMKEGRGQILLDGNVVARRDSAMPLQLETASLQYLARTERVMAPGEVLIRTQQGSIRAGAMEADLPAQVINLRNGVETRYVPPR